MRLHVPALTHTIVSKTYSHEPFTGNILRFAKMMRAQGCEVIEYGNEGSESEADEHVVLRTRAEFDRLHPFVQGKVIEHPGFASVEHIRFRLALAQHLVDRVRPGDFIVHGFGPAYDLLIDMFPEAIHVEPFIGYDSGPFGAYRCFVTESWRHWHLGRYTQHDTKAARESWVLPPFFDVDDWPLGKGDGGYFAFMARRVDAKGLKVLAEIIRRYDGPHHFRIAGPGAEYVDWQNFRRAIHASEPAPGLRYNVVDVGCLAADERAAFLGGAVALLCPSQYVEPGGGVAIEAQLCGTPVIASDWGCYTETVREGFRCRTPDDYLRAMGATGDAAGPPRWIVRDIAFRRFSIDWVGDKFRSVFEQIRESHSNRSA